MSDDYKVHVREAMKLVDIPWFFDSLKDSLREAFETLVRHRDCDWCDEIYGDDYDEDNPPGPSAGGKAREMNAYELGREDERLVLRKLGLHVCRTGTENHAKDCFWRLPYAALDVEGE